MQISGEGWPVRNKKKNNNASSSSSPADNNNNNDHNDTAFTYGDLLVTIKVVKGTTSKNKIYFWDPI